jgi:acetyltransferase-like isoleucine patch superfamily enzyme
MIGFREPRMQRARRADASGYRRGRLTKEQEHECGSFAMVRSPGHTRSSVGYLAFAVRIQSMAGRLMHLWNQPLSRKFQYCAFLWAKLKTRYFYGWRLRSCGKGSIILRPLFWTPEFVSIGTGVLIWPGCRIEGIDLAARPDTSLPHIEIGDGVTMQQNCHITAGGELVIEAGATILFDVMITDADHQYEDFGRRVYDQPMDIVRTRIGRNCFIGSGAKILAGTILGESCVVGANSVVRGCFPAGAVIAGIPGRIVKQYDSGSRVWLKAPNLR